MPRQALAIQNTRAVTEVALAAAAALPDQMGMAVTHRGRLAGLAMAV